MSFPTLTEVYAQTRWKCGDTEVPGGQIYTDALLLPHIQEAVRAMWRGLRNLAVPRVNRTFYYTLPANTAVFFPATALITDFSEPSGPVGQRRSLTSVAVFSAAQVAAGLNITTSAPHGLTTGDMVTLQQLVGLSGANVLCSVTVTGATTFTANGVVTTGTYTSGGTVVTSTNEFEDLAWATSVPVATTQSIAGLSLAVYSQGSFQFVPSNEDTQIRVTYWSSAAVPTTGSDQIGFNDCIDFVAIYAASQACSSQGAASRAAELREAAVGPEFTRGVYGGEMRQLLNAAVRAKQLLPPSERGPLPFLAPALNYDY